MDLRLSVFTYTCTQRDRNKEIFKGLDIFIILIMVIESHRYADIQTQQIICLNHVHLFCSKWVCMLSYVPLFVTLWIVVHQAPLYLEFSRQEYWSGLPFPTPGGLLTQEWNTHLLHLLHWLQILYKLNHLESPTGIS